MTLQERVVYAENVEAFVDALVEAAAEGFKPVHTGELEHAVLTNYWKLLMVREVSEPAEHKAPDAVATTTKKAK